MRFRPKKSIEEQGGIDVKLDSERELHNGFGAREFRIFWKLKDDKKIAKTAVAALMNVSTNTANDWGGRL